MKTNLGIGMRKWLFDLSGALSSWFTYSYMYVSWDVEWYHLQTAQPLQFGSIKIQENGPAYA